MTRSISWTSPHVQAAHQYALDVIAGRIEACKWVKAACQRQLADLEREWEFWFDESAADRVCRFVECLPHIKGPLAGQAITLDAWQQFVICTVFGWKNADGNRRYRRVYIEVPRGNAKSTLTSGIGLYMLAADGEGGAEVYSAATTRDQARIVFRDAQQMARKSPALCNKLGINVGAHNIHVLKTASKFEALASESSSLDGLNIHFAGVDELHAHKTREVYDVVETGTGKRTQSMLWCITTAGSNRSGICYEQRTYCAKLLDQVAQDESQFAIIYTIDDDDDWTDPDVWAKANPSWGQAVRPEVIGQLATKAMQMPAAQNNFKTKHLNVWVNADSAWMDMRAWDKCGDAPAIDDWAGHDAWIGLDLASKTDIAARLLLFPSDGHYYVYLHSYLPQAAVEDGRNSQYSGWEIGGHLTVTTGDVIDFGRIKSDLIEDSRRFSVRQIAYDPWQATQLAQELTQQGAQMLEYRNTVANFSEPMKEIDALVRSGRLHHDGNPALAWMISNVVCHMDNKDNIYPRKERPENKIDGVVALIMALGACMNDQDDIGDIDGWLNNPISAALN